MKKWLLAPALLLAFAVLYGCSSGDEVAGASWLHGRWELSYNPANDDEDILQFLPDGRVVIHRQRGGEIEGEYALNDRALTMVMNVNARPVIAGFNVSEDHQRLIFDNGAEYRRKTR